MMEKHEIIDRQRALYNAYSTLTEQDKLGTLGMGMTASLCSLQWVLCGEYRLPTEEELYGEQQQ